MDFQNAEFYRLNKNNQDLVYNFANEKVIYKKEEIDGEVKIVEYRKKYGKKDTSVRVVPKQEMSIEEFDEWKERLTNEALDYRRFDDMTTRRNISIENLYETNLASIEEGYTDDEEESYLYKKSLEEALSILGCLTQTQKSRYIKSKVFGKTVRQIALEEGCDFQRVAKSIAQAKARIDKEKSAKRKPYSLPLSAYMGHM